MVLLRPEDVSDDPKYANYKLKTPKRILQFSDGTLDDYSTDEEPDAPTQEVADPATMTWGPWMWYKTWLAGSSALYVIDYVGESLASFFGLTTPKYYFELEEYKRSKAEESANAELQKGWSGPANNGDVTLETIAVSQPQPVMV